MTTLEIVQYLGTCSECSVQFGGKAHIFQNKSTVQTIYVVVIYLFNALLAFYNDISTVRLI